MTRKWGVAAAPHSHPLPSLNGVGIPARPYARKLEPDLNRGWGGAPLECRGAVLQTGCELAGRASPLPAGARDHLYRAELDVPGLPHDGVHDDTAVKRRIAGIAELDSGWGRIVDQPRRHGAVIASTQAVVDRCASGRRSAGAHRSVWRGGGALSLAQPPDDGVQLRQAGHVETRIHPQRLA